MTRTNQELRADVTLLCELRVIERHVLLLEIGAAVLFVGIKKERIEPAVEVVMMGDIASRAAAEIELAEMPHQITRQPHRLGPARQPFGLIHDYRERVRNGAVLDDKAAVHIDFAERQFGVAQDLPLGFDREKTRENMLAGAVAAGKFFTVGGGEGHRATANELLQKETQQTAHRNHRNEDPEKNPSRAVTSDAWGTKWFLSFCASRLIIEA